MRSLYYLAGGVVIVILIVIFQPHLIDRPKLLQLAKPPVECPSDGAGEMRFTCNSQTHKCWCGASEDKPQ